MTSGRAGVSVVEAVTALVLGLLVVQLALGVLARARSAQARLSERAENVGAVRIARHVLEGELGRGRPGRDWTVLAPESLSLRAFRGVALVCPWASGVGEILVSYRGVRAPDPAKDSVLLLDTNGAWTASKLDGVSSSTSSCPAAPGTTVERWSLDSDVPPGVLLARVFERGSYHLSGGALRYRPGAAGRQPLTPEVLLTPPSGFEWRDGTVSLSLTTVEGRDGHRVLWRPVLWHRSGDAPAR